jgi:hypothetical protein
MKFFEFIQISSSQFPSWVYLDDVPDTPEPSPRLYFLYSKLHSLLPKSDAPNIFYPREEIPAEVDGNFALSTFSPNYLHSKMADIQYGCEHDLYSQLLSIFEHSQHYKFAQPSLDIELEHRPSKRDNDTLSPKRYALSNDLLYENSFYMIPYSKSINFIETKVSAINCRVLTIN